MIKTQKIALDLDRFSPRKYRGTEPVGSSGKPEKPAEPVEAENAKAAPERKMERESAAVVVLKTPEAVPCKPDHNPEKKSTGYATALKWKTKPSKELAFCRDCGADRPMLWKPPEMRGKSVDTWFVCAECEGGNLTIKMLPYDEAIRRNREKNDDAEVPF